MYRDGQGHGEVAIVDVAVNSFEFRLDVRECLVQPSGGIGGATLELEVGDQAAESQHRR